MKGRSVTGVYVYRGSAIPELIGTYVFGDALGTEIWGLAYDQDGNPQIETLAASSPVRPHTFAEGNDGELCIIQSAPELQSPHKLVPQSVAPETPLAAFPERLSETGCVVPEMPLEPVTGLISYTVNSPRWSDGAVKKRWMALPESTQLHVRADGDIEFPIGTVLIQSFFIEQAPVETRLLIRHDDGGWAGYSYEWLDDQSDAVLLRAGKTKVLPNGQSWTYPHRAQCLTCHTQIAGFTLGLELAQLNGLHLYEATGRQANQLSTLAHIGMFDTLLSDDQAQFPALAAVDDNTQPLSHRARSYLHTNCSGCHRPEGPMQSTMDLRFSVALDEMGACGAEPLFGDLNLQLPALIQPGEPAGSIVVNRMQRRDVHQMPPLATRLVDSGAIEAISNWILSLTTCE